MPSYRELTALPGFTIMDREYRPQPAALVETAPEVDPRLIDEDGNIYENIDDVPCCCNNCGCHFPGCCCPCWRHSHNDPRPI